MAFQYLRGATRKLEKDILQWHVSDMDRTRGNGFKLEESWFRLLDESSETLEQVT